LKSRNIGYGSVTFQKAMPYAFTVTSAVWTCCL